MSESYYPSKICRPILTDVLFRERLFSRLDTLRKQNVVWVSGPGGAGKTTLLNSYAEARSIPCLWYQLDSSDQDLATFFYYLGLAGKKANPLYKGDFPALTAEYLLGVKEFSRNFFSEMFLYLPSNSLLVFDNCQDVGENAELFNAILAALSRKPQEMNIVFISRNEPVATFSRLKANRGMSFINWADLRLTSKEFAKIAVQQGLPYQEDKLNELYELIDGWAAGLTLISASCAPDHFVQTPTNQLGSRAQYNIFEYYAEEVFVQLDSNSREFLVRSSLLPYLNEELVNIISDNRQALALLNRLYRSNIYITQLSISPPIYQYHQLFKDFLKDRCVRMLNEEKMGELLSSAAEQLITNGKIIEAAQLLIEAKDWIRLGALINTEAQSLFQKGQFQTLAHWLRHIPEPRIKAEPWLLYWSGMCIMLNNPDEGRKYFEQSLNGFEKRKDVIGVYLAASGLGDCLAYRFNSFVMYDQWIEKLGALRALYPEFPSKEIEAVVTISMLSALSLRQPRHSEFRAWRKRAHSLLEPKNGIKAMLKIQLLVPLILDRLFTGNLIEASQLIRAYRSLAEAKGMPTLALLTLKNFEGHYHWKNGNPSECCRAVNEAMDLASESGIHVLSFLLLLNGACGALSGEDHTQADAYLKRVEPALVQVGNYIKTVFHHTKNWKYLLSNEPAKALFHAERAQDYARKTGNPESSAWSHIGLALALYAVARHEEAALQLNLSMALSLDAAARQVTFACLLTQAEFALSNDDKAAACSYLKEGFTLGRDNGYSNIPFWRPLAVSKLCQLALQEGIETKYTQELIKRRHILPDNPSIIPANWPYSLRIFTLGKFEILHNDTPLRSKGKSQQKPLALLKLLISLGGIGVAQSKLVDALWPDADGDIQHQIFSTTLHRLRKLLGSKEFLILSGGELTLNNRLCWVDVWSFERHVHHIAKSAANNSFDSQRSKSAERLVDLYQGAFLSAEQESWVIPLREKMCNNMVQTIEKIGQYYFQSARWGSAIEWYRKGINIDPHMELFYLQLMLCYHRQEKKAEALQVYKQCQAVLKASMGITPSQSMQKLYEELRRARI